MTIATPTVSPTPGTYGPGVEIVLSQSQNLPIAYTVDGTDPVIAIPTVSTPFTNAGPFDLCFGPNGRIVVTGSNAMYYSDNSGVSWTLVNITPPTNTVYGIAYSQSDSCYYVAFYAQGIFKLDLLFTAYTPCQNTDSGNYPFKVRIKGSEIYSIGKVVNKSTDEGATWSFVCAPNVNTYASGNFDSSGNLLLVTGDGSNSNSQITKFNTQTGVQSGLLALPYALSVIEGADGAIYVSQVNPPRTFRSTDNLVTMLEVYPNYVGGGANYNGKTWFVNDVGHFLINIADTQGLAFSITHGDRFVTPIVLTEDTAVKAKSPNSSTASFSYTISPWKTKIKGTFSGSGVKVYCSNYNTATFELPLSAQTATELTINKDFITGFGPFLGNVRILVVDGEYISDWKDWNFNA